MHVRNINFIASTTSKAGAVAALAEERKLALYGNLVPRHYFLPVAFETSRVIDPQSRLFLKLLHHRISLITGEARSSVFLLQRLSFAVERENAAFLLGSISRSNDLEF